MKVDDTLKEGTTKLNKKDLFLASASFSSSIPRSEGVGLNEFKRSTYVTFYYRTIDPVRVVNAKKVLERKECYG